MLLDFLKKRINKIALISLLIIIGAISFVGKSYASVLYQQPFYDYASSPDLIVDQYLVAQGLGSNVSDFQGTFSQFQIFVAFDKPDGDAGLQFHWLRKNSCSPNESISSDLGIYGSIATSSYSYNYADGRFHRLTFNLSPVFTTDPTKCYFAAITANQMTHWHFLGTGSKYLNDVLQTNGDTSIFSNGMQSIYFQAGSNLDNPNSVNLTMPVNNQNLSDFSQWGLNFVFSTTTALSNLLFGVTYGSSSQLVNGNLNADFSDSKIPSSYVSSTTLTKFNSPPIGVYYAQAFLRSFYDTDCGGFVCKTSFIAATSSVISFTLTTQGDPLNPQWLQDYNSGRYFFHKTIASTSCSASIISTSFWSDLGSCTKSIFYELIDWSFFPSATSTSYLQQAINSFSGSFPFNIFFDFNNSLIKYAKLNIGKDNGSFNFTLPLPQGNTVALLTSTQLSDVVGSSTKAKIFELQDNIIWLGVGFLIVFTII